ncbi:MAG: SseB family protein [Solobacterium sp.]|nr:SseB family protein [Solobacterium sp.]
MANKKSRKRAMAQKNKQSEVKQEPITNPELVEALETLKAKRTPENEQRMLIAVHEAKLLTPVIFDTPIPQDLSSGRVQLKDNAKMKFVLVNTQDGKTFFPGFSDIEEANKLPKQEGQTYSYIVRTMKDFRKMLRDPNSNVAGVVINPMNQNIVFPKEFMMAPQDQAATTSTASFSQALSLPSLDSNAFHEPQVYPTALVNHVYETCKEIGGISRVWFKGVHLGMVNGYVFFVELEEEDKSKLEAIKTSAQEQAGEVPIFVERYTQEIQDKVIHDDFPLFDKELDV